MMWPKKLFDIKRFQQIGLFILLSTAVACGEENRETREEPTGTELETSAEEGAVSWDYENTDWETMGNNECSSNVQSPVDIDTTKVIEANLAEIQYEYEPFNMNIVDNGHTLQVSGSDSSFITVEGKRYQFKQFHFHNPSEHTINGKKYPLEMHLVHQEEGTDNLVVLGVLLEEGAQNQMLEKILAEVPSEKKMETQTQVTLSLSDVIPPAQTHYTYIGSLTTPPCTVGVDWVVFKEPLSASADQLQRFSNLYANSARPVQDLKNRRVLKSME